jgi:hypothetical protein
LGKYESLGPLCDPIPIGNPGPLIALPAPRPPAFGSLSFRRGMPKMTSPDGYSVEAISINPSAPNQDLPMPAFFRPTLAIATLALAVSAPGCDSGSKPQESAPPVSIDAAEAVGTEAAHSHAETYPEAVAELDGMREAIEKAFAANDPQAADEPIHEIGHVLEELSGMAKQAKLGVEAETAIDTAVEKLFDALAPVDEKLHGKEGKDYSEVKAEIDAAFEVLRKYVPKK